MYTVLQRQESDYYCKSEMFIPLYLTKLWYHDPKATIFLCLTFQAIGKFQELPE